MRHNTAHSRNTHLVRPMCTCMRERGGERGREGGREREGGGQGGVEMEEGREGMGEGGREGEKGRERGEGG